MPRASAVSILSTALLVCAPAVIPSSSAAQAPARGASRDASLQAALDTVSADEIKADIFFIASDELAGRDTISDGQRVAARFIRSRLQRLGVHPGGPNGSYFYEYPLVTLRLRDKESLTRVTLAGKSTDLVLGRDVYFSASTPRDLELDAGVVFCGRGESADLGQVDVKGQWALVLDDGGLIGRMEAALVEMGALGVLMTPTANFREKPYSEKFSRAMSSFASGGARWPSREKQGSDASLPFLYVPRAVAAQWIPALVSGDDQLPRAGTKLELTLLHKRRFQGDNGTVMAENVCGFWPGSDPNLARELIIISAHYDHEGYAGSKEIHNGADDNGSGTCGMLALAEALSVHGPLPRSVLLLWVSGEEKGLWGSKAWTEKPYLPEGHRPLCNLNIDMIGRNAPDYLLITPTAKHKEYNGLVKLAEKVAPLEGFPTLGSCDAYWNRSDHANFAENLKIPVAFLFSDVHEDYHKPSDDPEKIDCDKIRRVVRTVMRMIDGLQAPELTF
jgi:hypothetical protein